MPATIGYQAGTEANNVLLSYAQEVTFATLPAKQFQAVRLTGESLKPTKTRQRPSEFNLSGEVSAASTTQNSAGGSINFALSYGTFDDILGGMLNADWSGVLNIAAQLTMSAGGAGLVKNLSGPAGTFSGTIIPGQWVKIGGFAQAPLNGVHRVTAISGDGATIAIAVDAMTTAEGPVAATVKHSGTIINGGMFKSFYVQKDLGGGKFLCYPGSFVSGGTLTGGVGNFLSGSFTLLCATEAKGLAQASTGGVLSAPSGRVHDSVTGFGGCFLNGFKAPATLDSFTVTTSAKGAAQEFGMGSAAAQGMIMGLLEATGSFKLYFKDFSLYDLFTNETSQDVSFVTSDPAGNTYIVSLLNANLLDPTVNAGSANTAVLVTYNLEGNPTVSGGTVRITRFAAGL